MTKILLFVFIAVTSIPSYADDFRDLCNKLNETAQSIMEDRQEGVSMKKLMEIAKGNKLIENIIIAAYDRPRYYTKEMQIKSVEDFRDEIYLYCIRPKFKQAE
jgi:hypothetical protein